MGTIFKYNNLPIQCADFKKKLKKMRLSEDNVEVVMDNISNDILENVFVAYMKCKKSLEDRNIEFAEPPCFIWNGLLSKDCKILCINNILEGEDLIRPLWAKDYIVIGDIPDRFKCSENCVIFNGAEIDEDIIESSQMPFFLWSGSFERDKCFVSGTGYLSEYQIKNYTNPEWAKDYILVKGEPIFPITKDEQTGLPKVKNYEGIGN